MGLKLQFELMAAYNQWMSFKVYEAAGQLGAEELGKDCGAFFGSILGTLNHVVVGDTNWLKRFATHPSCRSSLREVGNLQTPLSLNQIVFSDFDSLSEHRTWLDQQIINWVDELSDSDLDFVLSYKNTKGVPSN